MLDRPSQQPPHRCLIAGLCQQHRRHRLDAIGQEPAQQVLQISRLPLFSRHEHGKPARLLADQMVDQLHAFWTEVPAGVKLIERRDNLLPSALPASVRPSRGKPRRRPVRASSAQADRAGPAARKLSRRLGIGDLLARWYGTRRWPGRPCRRLPGPVSSRTPRDGSGNAGTRTAHRGRVPASTVRRGPSLTPAGSTTGARSLNSRASCSGQASANPGMAASRMRLLAATEPVRSVTGDVPSIPARDSCGAAGAAWGGPARRTGTPDGMLPLPQDSLPDHCDYRNSVGCPSLTGRC